MRWLDWLRGHRERAGAEEAIDLERLLLEGFRDLPSARHAISRLTRERKELARQRRAVDAQFRRLTSGRVKTIVRDRSASPQMQVDMLSQAMQDANAATQTQAGRLRSEQLASIDGRLQAIEHALEQLEACVRASR